MNRFKTISYEQVQRAYDEKPHDVPEDIVQNIVKPIYAAYSALSFARDKRQPLDLDLPEREIELDNVGQVLSVKLKDRIDSKRLIEDFNLSFVWSSKIEKI